MTQIQLNTILKAAFDHVVHDHRFVIDNIDHRFRNVGVTA